LATVRWGFHAVERQFGGTKEMTDGMAMRMFSRGIIVGLFIGLYISWALMGA
jgi:hypothetical protein